MNILITSIGQRGYLIEHFKESVKGEHGIYAADVLKYAPALKNADKAFIMPYASSENYCETLIKICKENSIKAVFSINDIELPYLAMYKEKLKENGINAIICDKDIIDMCTDKYLTYMFCQKNNVGSPNTFLWSEKNKMLEEIGTGKLQFPIIAKPRKGSKSIGIHFLNNEQELLEDIEMSKESSIPEDEKCIYQETLKGVLIAAHVICNKDGEPLSIVTMKNLTEHFGETYQNTTYRDEKLFEYVYNAVKPVGAYGIIDLNIMQKENGDFVLLEFNPRMSGGYSVSHFSNPDFTKNLIGVALDKTIEIDKEKIYAFKDTIMLKQFTTTWTTEEEVNDYTGK